MGILILFFLKRNFNAVYQKFHPIFPLLTKVGSTYSINTVYKSNKFGNRGHIDKPLI